MHVKEKPANKSRQTELFSTIYYGVRFFSPLILVFAQNSEYLMYTLISANFPIANIFMLTPIVGDTHPKSASPGD